MLLPSYNNKKHQEQGGATVQKGVMSNLEDAKRYGVIEAHKAKKKKMNNSEAAAALNFLS